MTHTATTSYGKLRGHEERGVTSFKGIRYAAPPVGPMRFCAPAEPEPWSGTLDALLE